MPHAALSEELEVQPGSAHTAEAPWPGAVTPWTFRMQEGSWGLAPDPAGEPGCWLPPATVSQSIWGNLFRGLHPTVQPLFKSSKKEQKMEFEM